MQFALRAGLDCFAEPVIGRRFAPTHWLAMTWGITRSGRHPASASFEGTLAAARTRFVRQALPFPQKSRQPRMLGQVERQWI
jgi:hypothetical protein